MWRSIGGLVCSLPVHSREEPPKNTPTISRASDVLQHVAPTRNTPYAIRCATLNHNQTTNCFNCVVTWNWRCLYIFSRCPSCQSWPPLAVETSDFCRCIILIEIGVIVQRRMRWPPSTNREISPYALVCIPTASTDVKHRR